MTLKEIIQGRAGRAEKVRVKPTRPEHNATVACWFVTARGQATAWWDFIVFVIHLRGIPGVPPAKLTFPGAQYEVGVIALDPTTQPRPDSLETWRYLSPPNFIHQFATADKDGPSWKDDRVRALCRHLVERACDGQLPLELGGITGAVELWQQTIANFYEGDDDDE
jgi:hypothetical protein